MTRVLIVEDQQNIRKFVAVNLMARGYSVDQAGDGQEGLEKLRRTRPDVLLLDIKMPRMNGLEVLHAMSGEPLLEEIPVIVMTASTSNLIGGNHYRNVEGILLKPLNVTRLVGVLNQVLEKR